MGAPKSYRNMRRNERKVANTNARRADKYEADAGHMEHRAEIASLDEARRRKQVVEEGIDPKTGHPYPSIAKHVEALKQFDVSKGEMARIKSTIWHKINPNTGAIMVHPAGWQLAKA